ncbi:AAA domain-containing protein [Formosa undariae]|uniref:AAA domain-containing protein n=1 Tax=Formosa undariae TaxID=1325436 RepID=A0ABV5F5Q5_9FLAO
MVKNSDIKSWLSYWKKTLIDTDRKRIDITTSPLPIDTYYIDKVPEKHLNYLWNISQAKKDTKFINVDICPCSLQTKFEHGKSKKVKEDIYYPFWIPAIMYKDGTLAPQESGKNISKPFFIREYLGPNSNDTYQISTIKEVDSALQKIEFKNDSWASYWGLCESFFSMVTAKNFETYNIKDNRYLFIQLGELRGLTTNIRLLYNRLEKTPPNNKLLNTILSQDKIKHISIPNKSAVIRNKMHLGQMSSEFPLSVSQRESIMSFNLLEKNNILAVNGPPGTGKTTFLQSVIANSVVSTVIYKQEPELIIACSTNNQAITNILDSFALDSDDNLTKRWLPDLTSLGLYLSSSETKKYQTCTSEYGNGFFEDYENSNLKNKQDFFLREFKQNIENKTNVEDCKKALYTIVNSKVSAISEHIDIAERYENTVLLLKNKGYSSLDHLKEDIKTYNSKIIDSEKKINHISTSEKQLNSANKKQPFLQRLFHFLPKHKARRASLFERTLLNLNLDSATDYSNYNALVHILNELLIAKTKTRTQLKNELHSLKELLQNIEDYTSNYKACIAKFNSNYGSTIESLEASTGKEYVGLSPLEDMQVKMDISYRYEAFWYAIHFREAEYLIKLEKRKQKVDKERGKKSYREKLQRYAAITPIFISTFHSIPKYSTFFDKADGAKAYFDLYDLLIVDEAGQVAPGVSLPTFSLAKKAIVVGDVFQIEPVWSVEEKLDIINLKMNTILKADFSNNDFNTLKKSGLLCASGNLMQIAQQSCFIKDEAIGGTLLKEHRRCPDKIISFSDDYVYQNKLILTKGNHRKVNTGLPLKGFMHIDSESSKIGNSRRNIQDAKIISKWIESKREELIKAYNGKAIHKILAIVTPYKSQASLIKNELNKINKAAYSKITSGTVHALQGSEIDIVIFSSVLSPGNSTLYADNINMLNVAVSRAKSSFLVFGNLNTFDATKNTPLGNLKKWLQEDPDCELSNKFIFEAENSETPNGVTRIHTLKKHIDILERAFDIAETELIIISPFISSNAIECETIIFSKNGDKNTLNTTKINAIESKLKSAINRGVKLSVYTDSTLDMKNNLLKPNSKKGRELITQSGAQLKLINGIHNKTIIINNDIIIEGSFNWFSAVRDEQSKYYREEASLVVKGEMAKDMIKKTKEHLNKFAK